MPLLLSSVPSANSPDTSFPLKNLQGDGYRIGFGTCTGTVLAAPPFP